MYDASLGRLTKVNVRKKWPDEERDFTPWLSTNLEFLSSVLGLDLEFLSKEKKAGPFKADILAFNKLDGHRTVIENQLESANLRHLGQLLTYVAQLRAKKGVWIATSFRGTILRALRMLNEHWPDETGFFAVELGLYRTHEGSFLPVYDVVDKPQGWEDPLAPEFWDYYSSRHPNWFEPSLDEGSSMRRNRIPVEEADLRITQFFGGSFARTYVTGNHNEPGEEAIARIRPFRESLIRETNRSEFLKGKNRYCTTEFRVNSRDRCNWSEIVCWFEGQREIYEKVLRNDGRDEQ